MTQHFSDEEIHITEEEIINLDSIFTNDDVFDFIKIDTQGSELDILRGGENICKKSKAILLEVSILPYNNGAPLYEEVIKFMEDYGYKPVDVIGTNRYPDGTIFQHDILFLKN
jgi:hypothetical protein